MKDVTELADPVSDSNSELGRFGHDWPDRLIAKANRVEA
jgi:hypothetical protein